MNTDGCQPEALAPGGLRIGRIAMLVVAIVMIGLYVGPVQKYLRVSRELQTQRAALSRLEHRHEILTARKAALHTKAGIMILARQCGWSRPNEQVWVVRNIPTSCK